MKIAGFNKIDKTEIKNFLTMNTINRGLQCDLVEAFSKGNKNYSKDIKTYRLYDGDLYNIDL